MDSSFTHVPLNVPKLSGFDKSHQNLLTSKVGTITPIMIDELIPGTKVHFKLALSAQLPPLASDTFMRCSIKTEAFFIPFRLLAGSMESWFTDTEVEFMDASGSRDYGSMKGFLPCIGNFGSNSSTLGPMVTGVGTLGDYLGIQSSAGLLQGEVISAMPFLAYWRVIDDWYRNTLVERPAFVRPTAYVLLNTSSTSSPNPSPSAVIPVAGTAPYYFFTENIRQSSGTSGIVSNYVFSTAESLSLANGYYLTDLAQRNFGADYFTTATPSPQQGNPQVVSFNTSSSTGQFSIAALRAANSLQQFTERNNLCGVRYQDQLKGRYGVNLSSGVAQRAIFIKSGSFEVYSKGIYQNSNNILTGDSDADNQAGNNSNNPFGSVGTKFGSASAAGEGMSFDFTADEPGYLLVNATLVPRVTYSSGVHRRFTNYVGAGSLTDLANPILQNVGPQPIYQYELDGDLTDQASVFGYTDRYASFKTMSDELHGLVRDGQSLQSFALQRSFAASSSPQINTSFLKIPTTFLDQVTAVSQNVSNYGYWMDCYMDYKVAMPLAKYSLPSLQDPAYEHGRTVMMKKGGSQIN